MFQSVWNVAAAFCMHESGVATEQTQHFGHHASLKTCIDDMPDSIDHQHLDGTKTLSDPQDHADHLPSLSHVMMVEAITEPEQKFEFSVDRIRRMTWNNLYQSPELGINNPPPLSIPL